MKQRKRRNRKLTAKQKSIKEEKRQKTNFKNKIRNTFVAAGFEYLNTGGKHVTIGRRDVEIDLVVFFENIILICEDTATTVNRKDHIRKKAEAFQEISKNFGAYIEWLINTFPDKTVALQKYPLSRLKSFNLYFSQFPYDLTADEKSIYNSIIFIEPKSLEYFNHISKSIKKSARFEIFRFLSLHTQDIGLSTSTSENSRIDAPIIFPDDTTGFKNGIRLVSFMIDAETLLQLSYVLRKDNWEESIWLYQRLVEPKKLQSIRKFLATKETTFFNNIIVALPDDTRFLTEEKIYKKVEELENFEKCKLSIPREMNSICVIDGQHRIYAHYEGGSTDKYEARIAPLRKRLHLLVTGLIFPPSMGPLQRSQIQSEIFLDINDNAKSVPSNVLLHIEGLKDPFSDIGIARQVIQSLNKTKLFGDRFEMSTLEKGKIKIASIIKFALKRLVTINPQENQESMVSFWNGDISGLRNKDEKALSDYIKFVSSLLEQYFSALRTNFSEEWNNNESKILSVISINGFIIALTRQLAKNGVKDYNFYNLSFKNLKVDFSKDGFNYTSSQYRKFSTQILEQAFGFKTEELEQ